MTVLADLPPCEVCGAAATISLGGTCFDDGHHFCADHDPFAVDLRRRVVALEEKAATAVRYGAVLRLIVGHLHAAARVGWDYRGREHCNAALDLARSAFAGDGEVDRAG